MRNQTHKKVLINLQPSDVKEKLKEGVDWEGKFDIQCSPFDVLSTEEARDEVGVDANGHGL